MTNVRPVLRNRVFLVGDLIGWAIIPGLALGLRLESVQGMAQYVPQLLVFTGFAVVCKFVSLRQFGIYRRYWRYASIDELMLITAGVIVAGIVATACTGRLLGAHYWLDPLFPFPFRSSTPL